MTDWVEVEMPLSDEDIGRLIWLGILEYAEDGVLTLTPKGARVTSNALYRMEQGL